MCSTCGCRNAEEFQAPMTPADDICVACALQPPEIKSNICKGCQEGMGVKKLSQRQAAMFRAEMASLYDIVFEDDDGKKYTTHPDFDHSIINDMIEDDDLVPIDAEDETFGAEGNASKTTSSLNARFFVGVGSGKDLRGKGKFMKYNDAVAKAKQVAEKEGKARVVSTRGLALWTHDGKGLFQAGTTTEEAKKYYRAEDGSVDMDAYANDYMAAEDEMFGEMVYDAEIRYDARIKLDNKKSAKYIDQSIEDGMEFQDDEGIIESNITHLDAESFEAEMASEGIMRRRTEIPLAGLTLLALGYIGATKLRKKVTYDCEDCGCKDCEEKKAEGYPEVYDPVQDFLPKYRYPKDSVWSNDYNPADPYRALDYQTVHTDSNTKAKRM
jgi:hypothetical protein